MIWYILIILFVILLTWIILGPLILKLNSDRKQYQFMLPGVIKANVVPTQELVQIRGWIFFIPFRIDLSKLNRGKGKKRGDKRKKRTKTKKRSGNIRMIKSIPDAFQIRRLQLDLDTDDFIMNAWLIPAFSAINSHKNIHMQVNFEGRLFMDMDLRTRIASLLWIVIKNR